MSKKILLFALITLLNTVLHAQKIEWAKSIGSKGIENAYSITSDAVGNIYVVGSFNDTTDFDPDTSNFILSSNGNYDIFIAKYSLAGKLLWAKQIGGPGNDEAVSSICDNFGNIYLTGTFSQTIDFDPGPNIQLITPNGIGDIFVCKLDTAGNFKWAKGFGGNSLESSNSIATDSSGSVYTLGNFSGTADFDPGPGTYNISVTGTINAFTTNIFVSKLDSAGSFVWAKSIEGANSKTGSSICIGPNGYLYSTGYFQGTVDFDPGINTYNLTSNGSNDFYILKLDTTGNFIWAKNIGGSYSDISRAIAIDQKGDIYNTGFFRGSVDFNSGGTPYILTNNRNSIYISKYSSSGALVWATQFTPSFISGLVQGYGLAVDNFGYVYSTGTFNTTIDFDPSPSNQILIPIGAYDSFISKLDTSGNFILSKRIGGIGADEGRAVHVNVLGDIFTTGTYESSISFINPTDTSILISEGGKDVFVCKMSECGIASSIGNMQITQCDSYTGPSENVYTTSGLYNEYIIGSSGCDSIIILDLTITKKTSSAISPIVCGDYTSPSGKYTWSTNGNYRDTITNSVGCDSIIYISLTNNNTTGNASPIVCDQYTSPSGKYIWTSSGTYNDTLQNHIGCDSIITINLTINNIDTSIIITSGTLTANASGVSYQWLDCNNSYAAISGATAVSFTPSLSGNYAVKISLGGCTDTSSCYSITNVSLENENVLETMIKFFPNPSNGIFNVQIDNDLFVDINIYSSLGELVWSKLQLGNISAIDISDLSSGVYIAHVSSTKKTTVLKLTLQK